MKKNFNKLRSQLSSARVALSNECVQKMLDDILAKTTLSHIEHDRASCSKYHDHWD